MDSTCLNVTGFIQPVYVVKLLSQDDFDGFNGRQLYVCPAERDVDYDEFDPKTNPQLKRVYEIIGNCCKTQVTYKMDEDAHELFKNYHDELKRRKLSIKNDENRRGIIAKAIGQMTRVCMIVHVLDYAVEMAQRERDTDEHNNTQDQVSSTIGTSNCHYELRRRHKVCDDATGRETTGCTRNAHKHISYACESRDVIPNPGLPLSTGSAYWPLWEIRQEGVAAQGNCG